MTNWHVLLYLVAAVLALRSFVQLVTNYRSEFENAAVAKHLIKMAEELEADSQNAELAFQPEAGEVEATFEDEAAREPQTAAG